VTIAEFLLARIAEDEDAARRASIYAAAWTETHDTWQHVQADGHNVLSGAESVLPHVSRWDPARVLAECAAKRAIVEAAPQRWSIDPARCREVNSFGGGYWIDCDGERHDMAIDPLPGEEILSPVLAALAEVYADHPDYRQEWAQ